MIDGLIITEFILPIICIACFCIGYVLKNLIPGDKINRFIPFIVMIVGICLNIWNFGIISLEIVVTGAVSGLASTGLYELFAQIIEKGKGIIAGTTVIEDDDTEIIIGKHVAQGDE